MGGCIHATNETIHSRTFLLAEKVDNSAAEGRLPKSSLGSDRCFLYLAVTTQASYGEGTLASRRNTIFWGAPDNKVAQRARLPADHNRKGNNQCWMVEEK